MTIIGFGNFIRLNGLTLKGLILRKSPLGFVNTTFSAELMALNAFIMSPFTGQGQSLKSKCGNRIDRMVQDPPVGYIHLFTGNRIDRWED